MRALSWPRKGPEGQLSGYKFGKKEQKNRMFIIYTRTSAHQHR